MKFIFKLVIGMFLFCGMMLILSQLIPNATLQNNAGNVTNSYKDMSAGNLGAQLLNAFNPISNPWGAGIFAALTLVGVGGVLSGRNTPLFLGIAIMLGLTIYIFSGTIGFFVLESDKYPIVNALFNLLLIGVGFIALFSAGDILAGRSDVN